MENEQKSGDVELEVPTPTRRPRLGQARTKPPVWKLGKVVGVVVETPETNTLQIEVPDPTPFLPGQYYNIRIPIEGRPRPIQRAYSVGSSPYPDYSVVDVGIRETPGGLVSPKLVRDSYIGQELEVRGPYGAFTWTEENGGPVLLIGAGSGVVPLMAMIRYGVNKELDVPMHLLFSSKSYEYVIYGDELKRLSQENSWLTVSHTFTRSNDDARAQYHRRIDKEMISEVFHEVNANVAYICGPPEMVEESEKVLVGLGMQPESVKTEKYD